MYPDCLQYILDQTETFILVHSFLHLIANLTIFKSTGAMTMNIKTILLGAAVLSRLSGEAIAGAVATRGTSTPSFSGGMKSVKSEARLAMTDTGWAMSNECSDRT